MLHSSSWEGSTETVSSSLSWYPHGPLLKQVHLFVLCFRRLAASHRPSEDNVLLPNDLVWSVLPGWIPGTHQRLSITAFLSWTEERKDNERLWSSDRGRERSLPHHCHGKTRLDLEKWVGFITNSRIVRSKTNFKAPAPHCSLLPRFNFLPDSLPPPLPAAREVGNGS